jgi:hypothetical protein
MKVEKTLLAEQMDILLIPVPRQLSADCGMAVKFSLESLSQVKDTLHKVNMEATEIWLMQSGQFQLLS